MKNVLEKVKELINKAKEARKFCYTPYSHFNVGAAVLTKSGKIYTGCNIENTSFSPTICAERVAIFKAVSEGETEFVALAVVGGKGSKIADFCAPCGVCRQVIREFCDDNFVIILSNSKKHKIYKLKEILPLSFTKDDL